jgi:hypothetical protein
MAFTETRDGQMAMADNSNQLTRGKRHYGSVRSPDGKWDRLARRDGGSFSLSRDQRNPQFCPCRNLVIVCASEHPARASRCYRRLCRGWCTRPICHLGCTSSPRKMALLLHNIEFDVVLLQVANNRMGRLLNFTGKLRSFEGTRGPSAREMRKYEPHKGLRVYQKVINGWL